MKIIGTGFAVPDRVVPNMLLTNDTQWVKENIGIVTRFQAVDETATDLATEAAYKALGDDYDISDIGCIIVATATPDMTAPSTACLVAGELGAVCPAFDINAVCSGFMYGLKLADSLPYENILLIGVDLFSRITDYENRNCVFFGDGAGAILIKKDNRKFDCVINAYPAFHGFTCDYGGRFEMDGRQVYNMAVDLVPDIIAAVFNQSGLTVNDIDYMVPHQPSKRLLNEIALRIGLDPARVLMNMDKYANTSAATIPILLAENWHRFKEGDKLLFAAIGSGWTYGAAIYEI